ncbi:MAG: Flp pilus assembly complex ATPase component TadA [Firmicutes bacterium]|nr:Flp pilus assembly complex ATPase component TadA [Bacillota bacterium]
MEKVFDLESYMQNHMALAGDKLQDKECNNIDRFFRICEIVRQTFDQEWKETDDLAKQRKLEREKRAMMGYEEEMSFYKEKIRMILSERNLLEQWYPDWYPDLTEGIFAELYGLAGLAPWAYDMTESYRQSSSAKLIGDRIYCMIDGKVQLQPQRISGRRREQLKRTLLLATPHERLEYGFHEVYLRNGIRITIYSGKRTKQDQEIMVFRKYVLEELNFASLVEKKTIPASAVPLFHAMIATGFNVLFAGQVRSGKTTFLQIWQRHERRDLEGLALATDAETPWHIIMPEVPLMQLIADGKALEEMTKSLLRGDNDYLLMEEMRDGAAFRMALDMTSTGTSRCKATIHERDGINIPYRMASKICEKYGGDEQQLIAQVFQNFDYAIELCQDPKDKSKKIMKGILEYGYDYKNNQVFCRRVCAYDFQEKIWRWNEKGGQIKLKKYPEERFHLEKVQAVFCKLGEENGMEDEIIYPAYYKGNRNE